MVKPNYQTRIRLISICILLFALILIGRLYTIQIANSEVYSSKADKQYASVSEKIFSRGSIFFSNKDGSLVSAATLKSGYIIAVNPQVLTDAPSVYEKINEIYPIEKDIFITKATKKNDPYEEIANHVDTEIGDKINDLKIKGLQAYKEKWRFYPGNKTASHVVGLMGFQGNDYAGRYGLERQFEKNLIRKDGAYVNFFAEIFSDIKNVTAEDGEIEADVITTIEPTVQVYLESVLASTSEKWSPDLIGGIVMNPKNGEIYAMAVYPNFDPNSPEKEKSVRVFSNPLVESVYEMGSVIKPLTIASGIDAGVINAKTKYNDTGFVMVSNKKISNFDGVARGTVDMQEVLSQSLNVGTVYVQQLLGNKVFSDYMHKFGLGEKTGIDLPNEGRNLADNLKSNIDVNLATASFGQGIALTPISAVRALSVIANGGFLVNPHVVRGLDYKMGFSKNTEIQIGTKVLSRETAEEVSRMMVYSVDNVLSNGSLKLPNHTVAVKTGTAQIAKPGGGGYYDDRVLHSFVGHFPAYNAQFIVFIYMVDPKGARFGSETLAVPFMNTAKFLINYYEIPPDR